MNRQTTVWLIAAVSAVSLLAGACGSSQNADTTTDEVPVIADVDDGLPLADDNTQSPPDEGPCVEGEPECEDVLDDAAGGGDTVSSSGMTVNGGLSISEALASDVTGIVAVRGHLFDDGAGFRLCENLVGSGQRYECDGDEIDVTNIDVDAISDIVFFEGTTYTVDEITLFGELADGTLVVDPLVTG